MLIIRTVATVAVPAGFKKLDNKLRDMESYHVSKIIAAAEAEAEPSQNQESEDEDEDEDSVDRMLKDYEVVSVDEFLK